jgi:V/A-type H+-transporting ATPase subunit C
VLNLAQNSIKDTDYLYASSRIKALEKNLLSRERLERMCDARSMEEAFKVLSESGWPEISAPTLAAVETVLAARRSEAFALVRSLAPDKRLPDVFLIKYDYHNIKTILKSEVTGEEPEPLLINAGRISTRQLLVLLREGSTSGISEIMSRAIAEGRDLLARTHDAQLLDFLLDRAMFAEMLAMATTFGSAYLLGYVKLMIDSVNLRSAVRSSRMGKGFEILRFALIPGGNISTNRLLSEISADLIEAVFAGSLLAPAAAAGAAALKGEGNLSAVDHKSDDVLLKYLKSAKYIAFGAEPLIGYLAAQEAEMTAVRTVVAGRLAELSPENIIERLREAYV